MPANEAIQKQPHNNNTHINTKNMNTAIKLYDTDYAWFDGNKVDTNAIYAEESMLEVLEDFKENGEPLEGGEKFIKMTDLPVNIQNEFIYKIKTNTL